jgi:cell division septal protein FtsQ
MKTKATHPEDNLPLSRRRAVVLAAGFFAFLFALSAGWIAISLLTKEKSRWLPVTEVRFAGEFKRVEAEALQRIGAAIQSMGGSLLTIDLQQVRKAVLEVEWVREAEVSRRLPGTLVVQVEEHVPFARWESVDGPADEDALVNIRGEIFSAEIEAPLPTLAGPAGSAREVIEAYRAFQAAARGPSRSTTAPRWRWGAPMRCRVWSVFCACSPPSPQCARRTLSSTCDTQTGSQSVPQPPPSRANRETRIRAGNPHEQAT